MVTQLVKEVAVLNLKGPLSVGHYFDCVTPGGSVNSLTWEKGTEFLRFPLTFEAVTINRVSVMARRMDLSPTGGIFATHEDLGIYTCLNNTHSVSINISGGKSKLAAY